jgi:hypothetical protein
MSPPGGGADAAVAAAYLRTPLAIRARAENILSAGLAGRLAHFTIDTSRLPVVADRVVAVTRARYPDLRMPIHGRLGHFRAGGVDRVAALESLLAGLPPDEAARARVDLVVVSVLLDAGAGDAWCYREPDMVQPRLAIGRSEGLAVASLAAFRAGLFSATPGRPLTVDAAALIALPEARLAAAFQVGPANPLVGLTGRTELLHRLGAALRAAPTLFPGGRPGGLVDALRARGSDLPAGDLLKALLDGLGPIWPGRLSLDGVPLGDTWRHPAAGGTGPSEGLIPFHKLSQWLAYSLFEPLEQAGLHVTGAGALTGLPEYRNGGLLVDLGVLVPRHDAVLQGVHKVGDELVVEWRALTVALIDRVADLVRERLGKTVEELPLGRILEGGTWAAGREVAAERRAGGGPPIRIESDGTVF